jgi:hypothetical protein
MLDLSHIIQDMTNTNTDNKTEERKNRFTGESIMLTKEEAMKHDQIFMAEAIATIEDKDTGTGASKHWDTMRKLLNWFRQHNAKAYMVLLD